MGEIMAQGRISLARHYILQDGVMDAITISDSTLTTVILIDQGINKIEIPVENFPAFLKALKKMSDDWE